MKLKNIKKLTGTIRLVTGLHIGGSKDTLEIGGMDQPIIKHPVTKEPYIPGSSLKGKMRSLLEIAYVVDRQASRPFIVDRGAPCGCAETTCPSCVIFGTSSDKKGPELGPTRVIFRDSFLSEPFKKRFDNGDLPMEEKYENTIHRVKGVADHPRPLERVPAGVEFDFSISFKEFVGDDPTLIDFLYKGMKMIELDAIGGSTSRGSGQVKFENLCLDGAELGEGFLNSITL